MTDRVNVLGVGISPISMADALERIDAWVNQRAREYICVCTVHTVMQCRRSESLRQVVNSAAMNTPDGMPLVWLSRLAGHHNVTRVYGPDLMLAVMARSPRSGYRHFLYGGGPGVADELRDRMAERFPGVRITGTLTPPFGSIDVLADQATADTINQARPDIVWVGIGMPKQELWMSRMRSRLEAPVLVGVGAAFDFHTGRVAQAPSWMQRSGLEWSFRLSQEPSRLWRRYLIDNPWFLFELFRQRVGWKRFELN
jgi:N-acetylglucosaminyldiphosphoundecaprenol N-acetyl-beta-D-mannosaminyltransferase